MSLLRTTTEIHKAVDELIIAENVTNCIIKKKSNSKHWRCIWERCAGDIIRRMMIYSICKHPDCSDIPSKTPPYQFRYAQNLTISTPNNVAGLHIGDSDYVLQFFRAWMIDLKESKYLPELTQKYR